jgi:hypothetical protein
MDGAILEVKLEQNLGKIRQAFPAEVENFIIVAR